MYFVDELHSNNFNALLDQYPIGKVNKQYRVAFYIVAIPDIYVYCAGNPMSDNESPFDWYFNELNQYSAIIGLSFELIQLVKAGLCLYNNHKHDDSYEDFSLFMAIGTWNEGLYKAFLQACEIKRTNLQLTF